MNNPSSQDLLGYMLGALEPEEHQQIEFQIDEDPALREELDLVRRQVAVLDQLDPPGTPPAGLARRTCESISVLTSTSSFPRVASSGNPPAKPEKGRWFSSRREAGTAGRRGSLMDFVIVAAVVLLLAAIILPAINNSRYHSRLLACQNNLRTVGTGLLEYSSNFGGEYIPIPESGNQAFAGIHAPTLLSTGFVNDPSVFSCAGTGRAENRMIPTLDEIKVARGQLLRKLQKLAGGDFAYSLGQMVNGRYTAGRNENRSHYLILADAPGFDQPGRASTNHSGYGQNAFFEDGHIQFLKSPVVDGDAIYENEWGAIAPGVHATDIVVAPSGTSLFNIKVD